MIKGLFNLIAGLIRFIILLIVLGLIFHAWTLKQILKYSISYSLGAEVSIQKVEIDWQHSAFEVKDLQIGNPKDFPRGVLADIPLLVATIDLSKIPEGQIYLKALGINIREMEVIRIPEGGLNILGLKPLQQEKKGAGAISRTLQSEKVQKYSPQVMINKLIFSFDEISYLDLVSSDPKPKRLRMGIKEATYYNIRGTGDVAGIIVIEALKKLGFNYLQSQAQKLGEKLIPEASKKDNFFQKATSSIKDLFS